MILMNKISMKNIFNYGYSSKKMKKNWKYFFWIKYHILRFQLVVAHFESNTKCSFKSNYDHYADIT
jgi:hypothetical protein